MLYAKEGEKLLEIGLFSSEAYFGLLVADQQFDLVFQRIKDCFKGQDSYLLDSPESDPEILRPIIRDFARKYFEIFNEMTQNNEKTPKNNEKT